MPGANIYDVEAMLKAYVDSAAHNNIEESLSHRALRELIDGKLAARHPNSYVYIDEMYDDKFIYSLSDRSSSTPTPIKYYQCGYSRTPDSEEDVQLSDKPVEVRRKLIWEVVASSVSESAGSANSGSANIDPDPVPAVTPAPDPTPVFESDTVDPVDLSEALAGTAISETAELGEGPTTADGIMTMRIIAPGWGSSGYYSASTLREAAPRFTAGTHMYIDHPGRKDAENRPERSVKDLAATLVEDAKWIEEDNGKAFAGPGVYAKAKVKKHWKGFVKSCMPDIEVSMRGHGKAKIGSVGGKKGKIIESITDVSSVDFVTRAGAGGKILELLESARAYEDNIEESKGDQMDQEVLNRLQETETRLAAALKANEQITENYQTLQTQLDRMNERAMLNEARSIAAGILASSGLPAVTQTRLLANTPLPIKDGVLDQAALREAVAAMANDEKEYLNVAAPSRTVRDVGRSPVPVVENLQEAIDANMRRLGQRI